MLQRSCRVILDKSSTNPRPCFSRSCPAFAMQHSPPATLFRCIVITAGRNGTGLDPMVKISSGSSMEAKVRVPPTPFKSDEPFLPWRDDARKQFRKVGVQVSAVGTRIKRRQDAPAEDLGAKHEATAIEGQIRPCRRSTS
jgi:hypothetical protein